ncbi:MAG TPA: transporter substrate-binding domain-containing protein [Rhodopila sp.]
MRFLPSAVLACLAMLSEPAWSQDQARSGEPPLTVCLQANDPPLSLRGDPPSGFDLELARTIARNLGRDLHVQWFISRDDPDTNLVKDANALLSDGRCQLLAEYPLLESTLRAHYAPTVKLPPFDGATPDDRRRWVKTHELAATRPYRADALAVVLPARDADRPVRTLADLDGLKIGVQIATLADAIAMHYGNGRLIEHVVHLPDARGVFEAVRSGTVDAALVDLRAFDAWRGRHGSQDGSGALALSSYRHSLAFNMGVVGLASNSKLIEQVDAILAELQANDAIAPMAARAGLTFLPPRTPAVGPDVGPAALTQD